MGAVCTQLFTAAWSPSGHLLALASKDQSSILLIDPHPSSSPSPPTSSGESTPAVIVDRLLGAHGDSPRTFQLTWIDDTHFVSAGFGKASQRILVLYAISPCPSSSGSGKSEGSGIRVMASLVLDVSPSILYPVYDEDTSILYVWSKGTCLQKDSLLVFLEVFFVSLMRVGFFCLRDWFRKKWGRCQARHP